MVRPCCICGIKKNSDAASKGIRFFRFPKAKSDSHKNWVQTIRRHSKKTSFIPKKNSIICTHHFEKDCFNRNNRRLCLKEGSRPTIFNVDDSTNQNTSVACDSTQQVTQESQNENSNTEPPSFSLTMEDDTSESLSPPILLPLKDLNSDFEETIEDPPDLDMYSINQDFDDNGVTSFADLDMIKMDHIGSVGDILGPDSYLPEESVTMDEQPESSGGEERVEVDGQTILSFASAEEMQDYIARREARGKLTKTTDFKQIKGWQNKFHHLNQLTPSLSPSPCPSPSSQMLLHSATVASDNSEHQIALADSADEPISSAEAEAETDNVEMFLVMDPDESRTSSPEEELALEKLVQEPPELGSDGFISAEFAEWAASIVDCNSPKKRQSTAQIQDTIEEDKPKEEKPKEVQKTSSRSKRSISQTRQTTEKLHAEVSSMAIEETGEIPSTDMTIFDDSSDDVTVQEEEYEEVYDVPGNLELPTAECGELFCRLGCLCDSLNTVTSRPKVSLEHCSLPECMLQCVCGYLPGKPSSRKCFAKLLKGNESFYSKINWSGVRRRRERRVPERYSEFHLGSDPIVSSPPPPPPGRPSMNEDNRSRSSGPRGGNLHRSRSSSPFKSGSPSTRSAAPQQRAANDSNEIPPPSRNCGPFRVKVCADEIKLLRWDSFVSLAKVYVAPDQDIFCMEHSVYSCPCIEENRRIIRIASKYVPSITSSPDQDNKKQPTARAVAKNQVRSASASPPTKNVAKKHTNTNMRLISPKPTETSPPPPPPPPPPQPATTSSQEPGTKTSSMSKMRRLLQDERFQLQKLMTDEKTRAFDEEVDLGVRQGQTVQLVAWIRFHRIYHAGRIHIRFLSRRSGPVILVMRPSEIVAADITCDIQSMIGDTDAPEIVKELLDPCISPEETSRYAFLLCDGVKWELVGCLSLKTPEAPTPPKVKSPTLPTKTTTPATTSLKSPPKISDEVSISMRVLPGEVDVQMREQQRVATEMRLLSRCNAPARPSSDTSEERFNASELRRLQLEERLNEIKSKLGSAARKPPSILKPFKTKIRPTSSQRSAERPLISGDLLPFSRPSHGLAGIGRRKRDSDMTYLIPDQCILPDDMPNSDADGNSQNLPDLLIDQVIKEPSRSMYPAAEKLAMISRLIQDSGDVSIGGVKIPGVKDPAIFNSTLSRSPQSSSPAPLPPKLTPAPVNKPPEVKLLKLQPIGSALPNGVVAPNQIQRIRILTSPTMSQKVKINQPTTTSTLTSRNGIQPCVIQQQRIHWSNQGVKPPVTSLTSSKSSPTPPTIDSLTVMAVPSASSILPKSSALPTSILPVNNAAVCQTVKPPPPPLIKSSTSAAAVPTETLNRNSDAIFPTIFTAEVSSVKSSSGSIIKSLKIILSGMVDEQLPTNRASMLLPLHDCDDQWCLVSIDHVPDVGLKVPGLTVFIPAKVLERAASTAMERKARVSFPLHIQGKNMGSVFRKGFGVYGTPQLPRHVFLGPFPSKYLSQCLPFQSCLIPISLTKPVPNDSSPPNESSVKVNNTKESEPSSSTATAESQPSPGEISCVEQGPSKEVVEKDVGQVENDKKDEMVNSPVNDSSDDDEVSVVATLTGSVKSVSPVDREESVGASLDGKSEKDEKMDGSESDGIEIVDDRTGCSSVSPSQPAISFYQRELNELKGQKPLKVFAASTVGLPTTTMAVYDSLVRVKHPLLPQETLTFSSIDNAKRWLQSLTTANNPSESESEKSKENTSAEDSMANSDNNEDEIDVCGQSQEESLGPEETPDSTSSVTRSPKRIRRLTEKARILAANKSKQSRNTISSIPKRSSFHVSPSALSKRSSTQHLLHIRKEQERRGLLGRLLRDLDSLLVPDSGSRAKIAVLNNATSTIKSLQSKAKEMEDTYRALKSRRTALLTERERIFSGLPAEVRQIFNCLMDSLALPIRHLTVSEALPKRTRNAKLINLQETGRIEVELPNNTTA